MEMPDYADYDGLGLAELVRKRAVTPAELVEAAIARIEAQGRGEGGDGWRAEGARHGQPSSRCSSSASENISPATAGAQAASAGGKAPDWPNSSATLEIM